jgi:hypothetical protein
VDVTLYLPDELGGRAKAEFERGELSRLLQDAVRNELERRETVTKTLNDVQTYEVAVEDAEGRTFLGRITGQLIAENDRAEIEVFLTQDERVLVYDGARMKHYELTDPVEGLKNWLIGADYTDALHALGETPVVDL